LKQDNMPMPGPLGREGIHGGFCPGFTLIELLVAIAVMSLLLVLVFQFSGQALRIWGSVNSKVEQFSDAQSGLDSLVLKLSSATLNQYFGYEYQKVGTVWMPVNPGRRSELRFVSGQASALIGGSNHPTHAVFFVAPTGYVSNQSYAHLPGLLNVYGYYIEWSNQDPDRPTILQSKGTAPYRFHLMQLVQPSESMSLYNQTLTTSPQFAFKQTNWQSDFYNQNSSLAYPVANNIVAMILLPGMTSLDTSGSIAPNYLYNTESENSNLALSQRNRLPPVMSIVLYSIDENSAKTLGGSATMPNLYDGLFADPAKLYPQGGDIGDLGRFEQNLQALKLRYQRREATVQMLPQPWSTQQE